MVNSLWFKWRSLRLPWRKSFMVGQDLAGNTFWEFKDIVNANRFRRIVKFDPKTHYGDVQVTPQWHEWLRYLREHPPTMEEQRQDLIRQAQIKQLAQLADERWASKPSFLDKPKPQQPAPATQINETTVNSVSDDTTGVGQDNSTSQSPAKPSHKKEDNPWAQADRKNPGEGYQPNSWTPTSQR